VEELRYARNLHRFAPARAGRRIHRESARLTGLSDARKNRPGALRNAEDAIQGYLVSLAKHDEPIPHEEEVTFPTGNLTEALIYRVSVEVREVAQAA